MKKEDIEKIIHSLENYNQECLSASDVTLRFLSLGTNHFIAAFEMIEKNKLEEAKKNLKDAIAAFKCSIKSINSNKENHFTEKVKSYLDSHLYFATEALNKISDKTSSSSPA